MKKHFVIFVIVFLVTIGFAAANTVLDITGNINVVENIEDFKIEITNLKINNNDSKTLISKDKQSFTFTGSGNDTLEYTVTNYSYQYDASISLICTPSENITVEQIDNLPAQSKNSKGITSTSTSEITCTINVEKISRTDYAEDMCKYVEGTVWTFDYTGKEQEFIAPCDGNYKIEAWGAQGGTVLNTLSNKTYEGGYGGYSHGNVLLNTEKKVYINIGGAGKACLKYGSTTAGTKTCGDDGGYNGGGSTRQYTNSTFYGSGGGATHFSIKSGLLKTLNSNKEDVLIVSGGGGGASTYGSKNYAAHGGASGGYVGVQSRVEIIDRSVTCTGGSQTSAGGGSDTIGQSFGQGGSLSSYVGPGAGGGWYGGGTSEVLSCGGSSYIGNTLLTNKAMYCYNCAQSSEESTKTISTTCASSAPTANCAKRGNGYAKITYLGK